MLLVLLLLPLCSNKVPKNKLCSVCLVVAMQTTKWCWCSKTKCKRRFRNKIARNAWSILITLWKVTGIWLLQWFWYLHAWSRHIELHSLSMMMIFGLLSISQLIFCSWEIWYWALFQRSIPMSSNSLKIESKLLGNMESLGSSSTSSQSFHLIKCRERSQASMTWQLQMTWSD